MALIYCHNKITQYNSANVKLSNPLLNKLKVATKIETRITLKIITNMLGNSNDETNLSHKLLVTNRLWK